MHRCNVIVMAHGQVMWMESENGNGIEGDRHREVLYSLQCQLSRPDEVMDLTLERDFTLPFFQAKIQRQLYSER